MRTLVSLSTLVLSVSVVLSAQQKLLFRTGMLIASDVGAVQERPQFRTSTDLATVRVVVLDRHGKPVTDLSKQDFSITEDKKPQVITTFAALGAAPGGTQDLLSRMPSRRRAFLVLLGSGNLEGPVKPFEAASQFIRDRLAVDDVVAVMAFNRVTEFSTDHASVAAIIDQLKRRQEHVRSAILLHALNTHAKADIPESVQAEIDGAFMVAGVPPMHLQRVTSLLLKNAVFRSDDEGRWFSWERLAANNDVLKLLAGIEHLRGVDAERHLLAFVMGTGFTLPAFIRGNRPAILDLKDRDDEIRLATRANDARVALDIIHTYGVPPFGGQAAEIMASENLSDLTGGEFTGVRTADAALDRIDEASRGGYMLGYNPADSSLNGKYRNVTVSVSRPGLSVVYRHGYTAQVDAAPLDLRETITNARLREASATDLVQDDIRLTVTASRLSVRDAKSVDVSLIVDASRLALIARGDRHAGEITLQILCGDSGQKVVGRLRQDMSLSLDEEHYRQALATGIPYSVKIPVTGQVTFVRVAVYDYRVDLVGVTTAKVR